MEANNGLNNALHVPDGAWTHGPVQLARGRSAKDPNAQTASYTVNSLEDFESSLRAYLDDPPPNLEHAEGHFNFWIGATFLVQPPGLSPQERVALEAQQKRQQQDNRQNTVAPPAYPPSSLDAHYAAVTQAQNAQTLQPQENGDQTDASIDGPPRISMSVVEALAPTTDPKERMRKQRAIAKTCIDAIQKADGYRYSFHNNWNSREDDAFRFSYYCNDSLLNKDRAANGKGQKVVAGKRATKPVYDCRGVLAVKFSAVKQSLEVHYKHNPIHKTYEERAPPPRRDSKRRKWLLENQPDAIPQRKPRREQELDPDAPTPPVKKRKTKKPEKDEPANSIESSLRAQSLQSLLELIRVDNAPATNGVTPSVNTSNLVRQAHQATELTNAKQASNSEAPLKRRPRSSCEHCRSKRIKCDNVRPACKSCTDKGRECSYNEPGENEVRRSLPTPNNNLQSPNGGLLDGKTNTVLSVTPIQNSAGAQVELGEVEKMKAELELARQRIAQLEAEKTASPASHSNNTTPNLNSINTVNNTPRARELVQPIQPIHHPQYPNLQTPTHMPARHEQFGRQQVQTLSQQPQGHPMQTNQWSHWQQPYGYQPATIQPPRTDQWANRDNIYRQ